MKTNFRLCASSLQQKNTKKSQNKAIKSRLATFIKKYKAELAGGELDNAEKLLNEVVALLDSAAANNVIHKNNASRKQAHLRKLLDDARKAN